jgi:3-phytase
LVHAIVEKAAKAEDELDELPEKLAERFALEGCSYHIHQDSLFVGMENLVIWSLDLGSEKSSSAHLFLKISGSWTDIDVWSQDQEIPRITDDIEGMEVFHHGEQDFLIFSNQGISEFSLVELSRGSFVGNFKVTWGNDAVTHTDGLTIMAQPLSPELPEGVLVVHDDQNTAPDGSVQNANYKIVSLKTLFQALSTP